MARIFIFWNFAGFFFRVWEMVKGGQYYFLKNQRRQRCYLIGRNCVWLCCRQFVQCRFRPETLEIEKTENILFLFIFRFEIIFQNFDSTRPYKKVSAAALLKEEKNTGSFVVINIDSSPSHLSPSFVSIHFLVLLG